MELLRIKTLVESSPDDHRFALSKKVSEALGWYQPNGRLKDRSCRDVLLKLDALGIIRLPARRRPPVRRQAIATQSRPRVILRTLLGSAPYGFGPTGSGRRGDYSRAGSSERVLRARRKSLAEERVGSGIGSANGIRSGGIGTAAEEIREDGDHVCENQGAIVVGIAGIFAGRLRAGGEEEGQVLDSFRVAALP